MLDVDKSVAVKASEFNGVQQTSTTADFGLLNLKEFRAGFSGRAPGPEPDSSSCENDIECCRPELIVVERVMARTGSVIERY